MPISIAPVSSTQYSRASASSSTPKKVEPMPTASDRGIGRLSVISPTTGCNSEAVT